MFHAHTFQKFIRTAAAAAITVSAILVSTPAQAIVSGYTTFRTVYTYDVATLTFTDRTLAAGNATANDVPLGGDQGGDAIYFGGDLKFENATVTIGTGTAGGGIVRWDYWNGLTFVQIPGVSQTWNTAGTFAVNFVVPIDWAKTTVNGANRFWIRASWINPRAVGSVEPLLSQASVLLLNYEVTVRDEFGAGVAGLQDVNFTLSNCSDTNVYKAKDYGTGLYDLALMISGTDNNCDVVISQTNYHSSTAAPTGPLSATTLQVGATVSLLYTVSATRSTVTPSPASVPADNATTATVTVKVTNWNNMPLAGRIVTLATDHAGDTITGSPATTGADGVATFTAKSSTVGTAHYTATAGTTGINQQATVTYSAVSDATPPTVGAVSPTSATVNVSQTYSASVSDNVGISECSFYADGSAQATSVIGGTAQTTHTFSSAGSHTMYVRCADAAGNIGTGPTATITVAGAAPPPDVTPPTVGSVSPTTASLNASQTYSASVADNVGISECSFYADGASQATTVAGGSAQTNYTFTSSGAHTMYVRCADAAGNIGTGATTTITVAIPPAPPADNTPSPTTSLVDASPTSLVANGSNTATITVTVKNASGVGLSGKTVTVASNRPVADTIAILTGTTNAFGQATFTVRSTSAGTSVISATVEGVSISDTATVTFTASGSPPPPASGRLIKLACSTGAAVTHPCKAVYYVGSDNKRHAFPNDKVYFTWYTDFSGVAVVTSDEMSSHPLGKNVTYRPGVKLVKFTTLSKTYAVARGGVLRWITSEDIARSLYGTSWNRQVDDINDAFFANYAFGADIVSSAQYSPAGETAVAASIDLNF